MHYDAPVTNRLKAWYAGCLVLLVVAAAAITIGATVRMSRPADTGQDQIVDMPTISESAPRLRPHVAFIGDSYVGGSDMGGYGGDNFTYQFAEIMNWLPHVVQGVGGSGYLMGADFKAGPRQFSSPDRHQALGAELSLVFVINGFNDYKAPLELTEQAAFTAYERIEQAAPNAQVIAVGYLPLRKETKTDVKRNAALAKAAARAGVTFWNPIGTGWLTGPNARWLGEDRYHLTNAGHTYLAGVLADRAKAEGLDEVRTHLTRRATAPVLGTDLDVEDGDYEPTRLDE